MDADQKDNFLNSVLEALTHPFYVLDAKDYTVIMGNSAAGRLDPEAKITCHALTHRRDEPCNTTEHPCPIAEIKRMKKPVTVEHIHYDSDGNPRIIEVHGYPIFDEAGDVVQIIESCMDITERRQAEMALQQSESRFRQFFENEPTYCYMVSPDGSIININRSAREALGYSKEELLGKSLDIIYAPESRPKMQQLLEKWKGSGHIADEEMTILTKDGDRRFVILSASAVKDREGNILHSISTHEDITERKLAEEALAAEKERLNVTLHSIGDGVITTDTDGRVVMLNRVSEMLTGWTEREAAGRLLTEVFQIINEDTRLPCENPVDKVLKAGGVVGLANNTLLIARDGTERIIADSGAPIRDTKGEIFGVVLVFRDITERVRMESELMRIQNLESIGILAGGIAHDFNNVLTGIMGNISLAGMYMETDRQDKALERLTEAEKASAQAQNLTQQLLTFSRGGTPIKKSTAIAELLRDSVKFSLRGSNVKCEFSLPDDLWAVDVDRGQISQVISNLVINADQAMPGGGAIKVHAENIILGSQLTPSLEAGKYVRVSIEDQGVGIKREYLQRIFDPYFTTKEEGNGLGLATVYSIIKRHGGHISVFSQPGKGTTFHIYLPIFSEAEIPDDGCENGAIMPGKGKILLIDDDRSIRDLAGHMLADIGYEAITAGDGERGIELYQEARNSGEPFDAVIMDLTIPGGMGGKVAVKKLLKIDPDVKAIVSSGYSNDPVMSDFRRYGFIDIITKPYRIKEMSKVLHKLLKNIQDK